MTDIANKADLDWLRAMVALRGPHQVALTDEQRLQNERIDRLANAAAAGTKLHEMGAVGVLDVLYSSPEEPTQAKVLKLFALLGLPIAQADERETQEAAGDPRQEPFGPRVVIEVGGDDEEATEAVRARLAYLLQSDVQENSSNISVAVGTAGKPLIELLVDAGQPLAFDAAATVYFVQSMGIEVDDILDAYARRPGARSMSGPDVEGEEEEDEMSVGYAAEGLFLAGQVAAESNLALSLHAASGDRRDYRSLHIAERRHLRAAARELLDEGSAELGERLAQEASADGAVRAFQHIFGEAASPQGDAQIVGLGGLGEMIRRAMSESGAEG